MSWSNGSAYRIELTLPRPWLRAIGVAAVALLLLAMVVGSNLPMVSLVGLPLICWALWWRSGGGVAPVLLLASHSDQLSLDEKNHTLLDFAVVSAGIGLRLKDGKGMRKSLLIGPWNSSANGRRQLRLWLAHQANAGAR